MTERDFCYWLKGFVELSVNNDGITMEQWKIIKDHLDLVHNKITPEYKVLKTGELMVLDTPISC